MLKTLNELPTLQEIASDLTIDREYIVRTDIKIQQTKNWIGYKDLYPGQRREALDNVFKTEIEALERSGIKYRINTSSSKKVEGKGKSAVHMDVITRGIAFSLPAENAESFVHALCEIHNEREISKMISNGLTQQMCETLRGTDAVKEVTEQVFRYFAPFIQKDKDDDRIITSGPYKFSCSKSGVNLDKKYISYAEMGYDNLEENQLWAQNAVVTECLIDRMKQEPYILDVLTEVVLSGRPKLEFQVLHLRKKK